MVGAVSVPAARSTAVVFWWDFMEAIKAAAVFVDKERPVVRVELVPERTQVSVTSMRSHQIAALTVNASWMKVTEYQDTVFELSVAEVKKLQALFPFRRKPDVPEDEKPLIEIQFSEAFVFFYDATGLDLRLYRHFVPRGELEVPPGIAKVITKAEEAPREMSGLLEPWMMKNIFRACMVVDETPDMHFLIPETKWVRTKALTLAGPLRVLSTVMHKVDRDGELEADPGEEPVPELVVDFEDKRARIVEAKPPVGAV